MSQSLLVSRSCRLDHCMYLYTQVFNTTVETFHMPSFGELCRNNKMLVLGHIQMRITMQQSVRLLPVIGIQFTSHHVAWGTYIHTGTHRSMEEKPHFRCEICTASTRDLGLKSYCLLFTPLAVPLLRGKASGSGRRRMERSGSPRVPHRLAFLFSYCLKHM
jgi:hypothetical protein